MLRVDAPKVTLQCYPCNRITTTPTRDLGSMFRTVPRMPQHVCRRTKKKINTISIYVQLPGDNIPEDSPPPVRPQAPALLSVLCAPEPALDARFRHP